MFYMIFKRNTSSKICLNIAQNVSYNLIYFYFVYYSLIFLFQTEKKIFECPICKAVFDQVLALKEHVHIHAENGFFTCPQCNKVSSHIFWIDFF
jgi:hypothetical protein